MKEKHMLYFKLLEALDEGCPLCVIIHNEIHKLMDDFLYESSSDTGMREEIIETCGFCNRHSWQLRKFGDALAQTVLYKDLISDVLGKMETGKHLSRRVMVDMLSDKGLRKRNCMFCKYQVDTEKRYISVFRESFSDPEFNARYRNSFGLCLPHLAEVLDGWGDRKSAGELVSIEKGKLSSIVKEMEEFIRKHDYRFSDEGFGAESDAWLRAIAKFIGKEGVK